MGKTKLVAVLSLAALGAPSLARAETPAAASVSISNVTVTEGDSGQTAFTATVSLYSSYGSGKVKITATPGTASDNDYTFATVELDLQTGVSQTVSGAIIGDLAPEGDEYFTLTASAGTGYVGPYLISQGGRVTIVDDDQARASQLYIDSLSLMEGNTGTTVATLQVRLEPASAYEVTVQYQTQDGTARSGEDYAAASGKLTFAAGEVAKTIPIQILGDAIWETDEAFSVVLSQPSMALLGAASATVTVANDDPIAVPNLPDFTVDEGNQGTTSVTLTMTFDQPVPAQAKFWYLFADGGATAGSDFRATSTTLYPPTGATQMTFTIDVVGDTQPECDEGFYVKYAGSYGIDATVRVAKVILRNDDGPVTGCDDPFTPSTPLPQPIDGGVTQPPDVGLDAGPPPTGAEPDGGVPADSQARADTSTVPDSAVVPATAGPDTAAGTDLQGQPVVTPPAGDSGTAPPPDRVRTHSGCSIGARSGGGAPSVFALAGLLALAGLAARRRTRP